MGFLHVYIIFRFFIQHVHHFQVVHSDGFLVVANKNGSFERQHKNYGWTAAQEHNEDVHERKTSQCQCIPVNTAQQQMQPTMKKNGQRIQRIAFLATMPEASASMNFSFEFCNSFFLSDQPAGWTQWGNPPVNVSYTTCESQDTTSWDDWNLLQRPSPIALPRTWQKGWKKYSIGKMYLNIMNFQ